jgi:hypothetical protein
MYQTGFAESSGTNQNQMVVTVQHLFDSFRLTYPVGEKGVIYDGAEFKGVFHCEIFRYEIFRKFN